MRINFWAEWPTPLRRTFLFFGALLLLTVLYSLYADQKGFENIVDWQVVGQKSSLPLPLNPLRLGNITLSIPAENVLIFETYVGGPIVPNQVASYFFFIVLLSILILAISSITYLPKIWNIIMTLVFILTLWYFQFWQLHVFGLEDHTFFILVTVLYVGLAYYFRNIRRELDFITRLKAFSGLTFILGILIYFFSEVPAPFLLLSANGFLIFFLIGLVFVMMISYEILHFILIAITRKGISAGNNLARFTVFSFIYLGNVTLLLLYDTHVIDWNFYYLNPYVLLAISTILGLWGLQTRKELFKSISQYPILVFMYLVMALSCFGTLFYFLGSANDPILQVYKDIIIYSHFGFGSIFYLYIIINFMGLLRKNVPFEKVIYKPNNMPHFTFRFAGLMVVLGFALKENIQVPVYQTISGQYNNIGDYHLSQNNLEAATAAYEEGKIYGYMNHKSNYALGKIYEQVDIPKAVTHYSNAIQARPSEMAFVNLSSVWSKSGDLFNSLFILSDAQAAFPRGSKILNNKGFLFYTMHLNDSALIYYDAAFRSGHSGDVSVTNYLGLAADLHLNFNSDSIITHYGSSKSIAVKTNALALDNATGIERSQKHIEVAPTWNMYHAAFLNNYLLNQYKNLDSGFYYLQDQHALMPENMRYSEEIRYQSSLALYQKGHVNKAIEILENLSVVGPINQGKHLFTLGVIRSAQQDYDNAKIHFNNAISNGFPHAKLAASICEYISGDRDSASLVWDKMILEDPDSTYAKDLMRLTKSDISTLTEEELLSWVQLHPDAPNQVVDEIMATISDPLVRDQMLYIILSKHLRNDNLSIADQYLSMASDMSIDALQRESILINISLDGAYDIPVTSFDDLNLLRNEGDPYDMADSARYKSLARINAYNIPAVVEAVNYYRLYGKTLDAYNVLLDALRINPHSVPLVELYIEECLNEYLASYALNGLKTLHQLVDNESYNEFIFEHTEQLSGVFNGEQTQIDQ